MNIQFFGEMVRAEESRASQDRNSPARKFFSPSYIELKKRDTKLQELCFFLGLDFDNIKCCEKVICENWQKRYEVENWWYLLQKRREEMKELRNQVIELKFKLDKEENEKKEAKGFMYAITLTVKAEECKNVEHWKEILSECTEKIISGKNIIEKDWQLELTKKGIPHVHIYVKSTKYIKKQELVKKYPHGYVYCKKVINRDAYLAYVAKERNLSEA